MGEMNRLQNLLGALGQFGFQPSFERAYTPGREGALGTAAAGLGQGLGSYIGSGGNPLAALGGALQGSGFMEKLASLFGGRSSGYGGLQGGRET